MKFAKLGFETKEGLSLAHFQDGWSMEYGEGGSYHCELLYKGKPVTELTEEGNGGPLNYWFKDKAVEKEVSDAVIAFLKRTEPEDYGPNSQYEWCRNITKAGDCEYSMVANALLDEYDRRKTVAKYLKKGYNVVMLVKVDDFNTRIVAGTKENPEEMKKYAEQKGIKGATTVYIQSSLKEAL